MTLGDMVSTTATWQTTTTTFCRLCHRTTSTSDRIQICQCPGVHRDCLIRQLTNNPWSDIARCEHCRIVIVPQKYVWAYRCRLSVEVVAMATIMAIIMWLMGSAIVGFESSTARRFWAGGLVIFAACALIGLMSVVHGELVMEPSLREECLTLPFLRRCTTHVLCMCAMVVLLGAWRISEQRYHVLNQCLPRPTTILDTRSVVW